tara:strand:+ start:546 stop:866 length:321 start_codon:yes stop_codon:yes gene_type:complete
MTFTFYYVSILNLSKIHKKLIPSFYAFLTCKKSIYFFCHPTMPKTNTNLNRSRNPMDFTFNDVEPLSRFVTETGKILSRKETGLSAKHQRRVTKKIKQARNMVTMK